MTVLISVLAFFVLLSFLVLIHELGHFIAARKSGVIVEEFGFGLPPRAKTLFTRGGTRFSLNWVPFGGFVRLRGENAVSAAERDKAGSFARATFPQKVLILTAGVLMNFLVAMVIFTVGFSVWRWVPTYMNREEIRDARARGEIVLAKGVTVSGLVAGGPAEQAGIPVGSEILRVEGKDILDPRDVIESQTGLPVALYRLKLPDGSEKTVQVRLDDGKAGVILQSADIQSPMRSPVKAVVLALREAKVMTVQTVVGLAQLVTSLVSRGQIPEGVTGVVGIAVMTHDTIQVGWLQYLRLVAVLSLSLAILNILPFPALDGGRLAFVVAEFVLRRPAPRRFELITNSAGFVLLIGLILLITYHDVLNLFTGDKL